MESKYKHCHNLGCLPCKNVNFQRLNTFGGNVAPILKTRHANVKSSQCCDNNIAATYYDNQIQTLPQSCVFALSECELSKIK